MLLLLLLLLLYVIIIIIIIVGSALMGPAGGARVGVQNQAAQHHTTRSQ